MTDPVDARGRPGPRRPAGRLAIALCALTVACGPALPPETTSGPVPVILVAVDGLEWSVLRPLLADGRLPNLARLIDRGVAGRLESMIPTFSSVIWTTIATGKPPAEHGIEHFVYETEVAGRREIRPYTSGHRRTKAFWNILSDRGKVNHCIGWWITYPVEPIDGVMVSQTNTTEFLDNPEVMWKGTLLRGVEGQVHPPDEHNAVMDILADVDRNLDDRVAEVVGRPPNPPTALERRLIEQSRWAIRADATYLRIAERVLARREPFDLLAVYLGGPDVLGHRFWRYAHPQMYDDPPAPDQVDDFGEVVDRAYESVDAAVGRLLARAPDDAAILIVSDHGMHAANRGAAFGVDDPGRALNSGHHLDAPPGVLIAAGSVFRGPDDRRGSRRDLGRLPTVGSVLDVLPTLLAVLDVPVGEDMAGVVMDGVVSPQFLSETGVATVPTHDTDDWLAARGRRVRDAVGRAERLEQLRSLGYID